METIRITEEHWEPMRDLRLEMLADTPIAYVETLEEAQQLDEQEWRFRARRCAEPNSIGLAAVGEDGTWVGTMSAYLNDEGVAFLVGVYVSPGARGTGVADRLLDEIEDWLVDDTSTHVLTLEVHENNDRAQAFYRRRGYLPTGETVPYPLNHNQSEIVMVKVLTSRNQDA